jgi:hypothetical protein
VDESKDAQGVATRPPHEDARQRPTTGGGLTRSVMLYVAAVIDSGGMKQRGNLYCAVCGIGLLVHLGSETVHYCSLHLPDVVPAVAARSPVEDPKEHASGEVAVELARFARAIVPTFVIPEEPPPGQQMLSNRVARRWAEEAQRRWHRAALSYYSR